MNISLSQYLVTEANTNNGAMGFNNFSIRLWAENDYSYGEVKQASINLSINYSLIPKQRFGVITFVIVILLVFLSMILFLFLRSRELKYDAG